MVLAFIVIAAATWLVLRITPWPLVGLVVAYAIIRAHL